MPPTLIPARILRAHADDLPQSRAQRPSTIRELARQDLILDVGQLLFARFGMATLSVASLARALRLSPATFHRYFCDLDELLAAILRRHIKTLSAAIAAVPWETPVRQKAQRAAYVAATRCGMGGHTEAHRLLLRDGRALPADLAEEIEALHLGLGQALAGDDADLILPLLDTPYRAIADIERMVAALRPVQPAAAARATRPAPRRARAPISAPPPLAPPPANDPPAHIPFWLTALRAAAEARAGP